MRGARAAHENAGERPGDQGHDPTRRHGLGRVAPERSQRHHRSAHRNPVAACTRGLHYSVPGRVLRPVISWPKSIGKTEAAAHHYIRDKQHGFRAFDASEACYKLEKCRDMLLIGLASYGEIDRLLDAQWECGCEIPKKLRVIVPAPSGAGFLQEATMKTVHAPNRDPNGILGLRGLGPSRPQRRGSWFVRRG